jgi:hypothetical protein
VFLGWWIAYELIPGSVSPPSGFTKFKSSDNRFAIDQPLGWDVTSNPVDPNSDSTMGSALFRSGSAKINITSDTVGDIKGQVLLYSSNVLPPDFSSDPADALHDLMKSRIAATMKNYVEQPAITVDTNFGTARVSEFTGVGGLFGLGGPMHGYRASVSDGQCGFEIVEQCPEKSWSGMSQPFRNVIQSIGPADGSAFTPPPSSGSPMPGIPAIPGAAPTPSQPAPPSSAQNDYGARRFEGANGYGGGGNGGRGGGGYGGGNAAGADNGASNPAGAAGYGGGSSDDTDTGQ